MLDKVNVGIILVDEQYQIQFWNSWLEEYSGIAEEEVMGENLLKVFPVFDKPYYRAMFQNVLTNHQNMFFSGAFHPIFVDPNHRENRFVKQNLQVEPLLENGLLWMMLQIEDTTNQYQRVQKLNEKIEYIRQTQRALKSSEEKSQQLAIQAKEANEAKSRFLAHMSHEIRTPLNGIIGFIELLQSTPLTNQQQKYIKNANLAATSLLSIVNDILDFSKIEAKKMELYPVASNIRMICQEALDMLIYMAEEKGLQLSLQIESTLWNHVLVDSIRLKQILLNLLGNAIKFTKEGSVTLKVSSEIKCPEEGIFYFEMIDTGIGIPEEQQNRLFQAFSQADNSTTRQYGGTGLGLVISNVLANLMNSEIKFNSEFGSGSTFYFQLRLPLVDAPSIEDSVYTIQPSTIEVLNALAEPKILVVDDVPMNLQLVKEMIRKVLPKAKVVQAFDGQLALEVLERETIDLVLMDIQMPLMDGVEATRRFRLIENDPNHQVPIIALSAGVTPQERIESQGAGMNDFLGKPIQQKQLLIILKKYLKLDSNHHFNQERLMKQLNHSEESYEIIKETAINHFPETIEELGIAIRNKDIKNVMLVAHSLKGASMNMAMDGLVGICQEIEKLALSQHTEDWDQFEEMYQEAVMEWKIILRELDQ